ncbi:Rid family hydrolase [uncultured Paracoccus sp.]|uniref:Rid family hydrolase n=1 Tax=uncultured Paracoccus sp. TaxID=189685 RepID=UPI0025EE66FC|nr:Rid family hydrolase [uncultured Paracoccus sp.]
MSIQKTGRIDSWGPKIFLGSAAGDLASVCLTAPDKAQDFQGQSRAILGVVDDLLGQMGSGRPGLIMAQVWLADIGFWPDFVPIWNDWIGAGDPPGLSVVQMAASRRDSLLEIRVWAERPGA